MTPRDNEKAKEAIQAEEDGRLEEAVNLYREAGYILVAEALQEIIDEDNNSDDE